MHRHDIAKPIGRTRLVRLTLTCLIAFVCVLVRPAFAAEPDRSQANAPKYVFFFIGDGMGLGQRYAAEVYEFSRRCPDRPGIEKLTMSRFPVHGLCTTHSKNRLVTDSAAAGTACACGFKTANGTVGMNADGTKAYKTIAELAKAKGMKVGIISSVALNHATPACFYSHRPSRNMYDEIAMDLIRSDVDYFAGGGLQMNNNGDKPVARIMQAARDRGITIVRTRNELNALKRPIGRVLAINHTLDEQAALYYEIERPDDHLSLAEFTAKGIELLDNPNGFFVMVEGGRIDWVCHANDAASVIHDVIAFDQAVSRAVEFFSHHRDDTLIVVTADHETGGMTIGSGTTSQGTCLSLLAGQKVSYLQFDKRIAEYRATHRGHHHFEDVLSMIDACFGLKAPPADGSRTIDPATTLTADEIRILKQAFAVSMGDKDALSTNDLPAGLDRGRNSLRIHVIDILNRKAGVHWISHGHTAYPVPVMAMGVGQEKFDGYYDNTELSRNLMALLGVAPRAIPASSPATTQAPSPRAAKTPIGTGAK